MDATKQTLDSIIKDAFGDGSRPLEARRCLHWAEVKRPDILLTFLPDLERVIREGGNTEAAEQVAALTKELRSQLPSPTAS